MAPTSTRQANERLVLDSAFFVAFELAHEGLKSGLHEVSCLNCTQYRVLVKLAAAEPEGVRAPKSEARGTVFHSLKK